MRVLLTGAGGAIGVHFIAHFMHNTDWKVIGIDSFRHKGNYDRITRVAQNHSAWLKRLKIISHDLTAPLSQRQIKKIGRIDHIINLASQSDVQDSIDDPIPFVRNNTELMLNILQYATEVKPISFIQFSTDEVYGPTSVSGGHDEWDPILPSNPYSASKAAQEAIAIAWWRAYGLPLIITNTMNNFGEMQSPSKFPAMVQKLVSGGETVPIHATKGRQIGTRYYIHSRNVADAVLFLLKTATPTPHKPGHIDRPDRYNIVGDAHLNNLSLARLIAKLMGKKLKYKLVNFHKDNPGHDLHYGLDGGKLAGMGWKPPLSFEQSIKNTIEWQQRNKEWLDG